MLLERGVKKGKGEMHLSKSGSSDTLKAQDGKVRSPLHPNTCPQMQKELPSSPQGVTEIPKEQREERGENEGGRKISGLKRDLRVSVGQRS